MADVGALQEGDDLFETVLQSVPFTPERERMRNTAPQGPCHLECLPSTARSKVCAASPGHFAQSSEHRQPIGGREQTQMLGANEQFGDLLSKFCTESNALSHGVSMLGSVEGAM